jgi:hypothetical protein
MPPLAPAYDGPYLVLELSPHMFRLQVGDKVDVVTTARLKAPVLSPDTAAAAPPRHGHPPGCPMKGPDPPTPLIPADSPPSTPRPPNCVSFAIAAAAVAQPSG